jgi:phenylpropionate dioxygenase-like ring-hydroxylating dioxygenase large terminal subunit
MRTMHVGADGFVPKERYVSREFADREMERLWYRVWQVACREEEIGAVGDYAEYVIGDQSILVVRTAPDEIKAYFNACLHRGTRLADGYGNFAEGTIRCRYHAWRYELDGRIAEIVDGEEFGDTIPADLRLGEVRCERWGGFVYVNLDADAEPLLEFLDPLPTLLAPYRFEDMRLRGYLTTILPANWKVVVDAFNEAYHVQGTHPQILAWTDDVAIRYEQLGKHAHYGTPRRVLRPSPRLGLAEDEYDEGTILRGMVASLGGTFLKEERTLVDEVLAAPLPPGVTLIEVYQERRRELLTARGLEVSAFAPDQLTSADDVYWFPNMVGPVYPGSAILFRVRPDGLDPDRAIHDTWVLEAPRPGSDWQMPARRAFADWEERDWGLITNQDYSNMVHVQTGMKSRGFRGLRLNPRQEANLLHMHRVIDEYLDR